MSLSLPFSATNERESEIMKEGKVILQHLEQELNALFTTIETDLVHDTQRLHVSSYIEVLDRFTKPANLLIVQALKDFDNLEFKTEIRNLIHNFRMKIANNYNGISTR